MFSSGKGTVLLDALESIIIPIVKAHFPESAPSSDDVDRHHLELEPAAHQVVVALETFVNSLVSLRFVQQNGNKSNEDAPSQPADAMEAPCVGEASSLVNAPLISTPPTRPRLLRLAMDEARHRVFNKIPIRLLAFNPDGSGIELLERDEIWARVSPLLEANFDQDAINLDVDFHRGEEGSAIDHFISKHVTYAILSHTWLSDPGAEVVYSDWKSGAFDAGSRGYLKLVNFCRVAAIDHKVTLGWMDTVCINKESSTELDESIRSMYKWYCDADVCITYLAQTETMEQMRVDAWFTRGWTLQELLAPRYTKFYNSNWVVISSNPKDDRNEPSIGDEIQAATTITPSELAVFQKASYRIPISRRMQWAANRRVKREEDIAYSLMGVFDISMSIAYGEGSEWAFFRLVKKILKSTKRAVLDIVNWGYGSEWRYAPNHPSSVIPSSPRDYIWRTKGDVIWFPPTTPITLTHLGLHLPVLLMPAVSAESIGKNVQPIGNYYATASIIDAIKTVESSPKTFHLLDKAAKRSNSISIENSKSTAYQKIFGVLNFCEQDKNIFLPDGFVCFGICLYPKSQSGNFERMPTSEAFTFLLRQVRPTNGQIPKSELAKHGMQLVTMYL